MQIFDLIAHGNAVNTANDCQIMNFSHVEKDLNRNEHLNLNIEQSSSLTAASPKI